MYYFHIKKVQCVYFHDAQPPKTKNGLLTNNPHDIIPECPPTSSNSHGNSNAQHESEYERIIESRYSDSKPTTLENKIEEVAKECETWKDIFLKRFGETESPDEHSEVWDLHKIHQYIWPIKLHKNIKKEKESGENNDNPSKDDGELFYYT